MAAAAAEEATVPVATMGDAKGVGDVGPGLLESVGRSAETVLGVSARTAQVLTWLMVLAGAYLVLQVMQVAFGSLFKTRRQRGRLLLLLGQCGSGKTTLFFQLRDPNEEVRTVSSQKANRDKMLIQQGQDGGEPLGPIEVVDCPGHLRMRGRQLSYMQEARCIVYVIDAEDKQRLKDVAEHLYEILTHPDVIQLHIPILLACNKCDLPGARTEKFIVEEVEREMEAMRVSRGATLEGQDQADSYLGIDGEKFRLLEHAPCPIQTCIISAKKGQLSPLFDLLREQYA